MDARLCRVLLLAGGLALAAVSQAQDTARIYNTAEQKLARGQSVFGCTIMSPHPIEGAGR